LLTVLLACTFWIQERRKWLRWLGVLALALVIVQGVLGGLRVVWLEHALAIVHACFAQAFFALIVSLAIFTSAEWSEHSPSRSIAEGGRLWRLCAITTALIYVQAIFGAVLRHTGGRLDAHLLLAALVTLHVGLVVIRVMRLHSDRLALVRSACLLGLLLLVQLIFGTASYFGKFTSAVRLPVEALVFVTTTHLVIGALMLAASVGLTLRCFRLFAPANPVSGRRALTEQYSL
jgi:cytochrome c oxidase assembly protein subunit 15